jgi:tRNA modification GTPase
LRLDDDTIAAVATARGPAALGIVRISGPRSAEILTAVVPGARAAERPRQVVPGRARCLQTGEVIDEVLCFHCPGPRTATGEDTAEIQAHGGTLVLQRLLEVVVRAGARPARPGEFTARAFLNGRIDLTQAEAVMALIGARSERSARAAVAQLQGAVGDELGGELDALTGIAAQVEAGLDFPDEDLPLEEAARLAERLERVAERLAAVDRSHTLGRHLVEGARVVIVGPTNAGKSTLLNRLVGQERALVDHEPGTTRDTVEAAAEVAGIPVVYEDTAGLRPSPGRVERQGIERTRGAAVAADLLLVVIDAAEPAEPDLSQLEPLLADTAPPALVVLNKLDLPDFDERIPAALGHLPNNAVSALEGDGIENLVHDIGEALGGAEGAHDLVLVTARQHDAVATALTHARRALEVLREQRGIELAAIDLRVARESLAGLFGRDTTEDVIDAIFAQFCLGK